MLDLIKQTLAFYFIIPVIFLAGLYFSIHLRFMQITKIYDAVKYTIKTSQFNQKFSSFGALTAVLGGNLGTGNIAGIAVALTLGGPGSLFWMVIMVLCGSIIKFCCCFLGIKYREKSVDGSWVGGPMYYLAKGLNCRYLDKIFCLLLICSAITTGNFIQIHSITLPLNQAKISPFYVSSCMALLIGLIMLGGLQRFSKFVTSLVPIMAIFYIVACVKILLDFKTSLLPSLNLIIQHAFCMKSFNGAGVSWVFMEAIRVGFDRGIMATDTGIGVAPILHAKVIQIVDEPSDSRIIAIQQGLISMLAPILVLGICLLTGLVLLVTDGWKLPLESTEMCLSAFAIGLKSFNLSVMVVNVTLCLFAITTILTWGVCADNAIQYLFKYNKHIANLFKGLFVLLIPFGVFFEVRYLWNLADIFLNLMLLINMYGVIRLFKKIIADMQQVNYLNFNKDPKNFA